MGEDVRRGRYYLPAEDLARFDCTHEQLAQLCSQGGHDLDLKGVPATSPTPSRDFSRQTDRLRQAVAFEVARARTLLTAGPPLVAGVRGRPKLALAAFVAGGEAALGAIERAGCDVLGPITRPGASRRVRLVARVLVRSRGGVATEATSSSRASR
jgi:phytoene/squalene synthetase